MDPQAGVQRLSRQPKAFSRPFSPRMQANWVAKDTHAESELEKDNRRPDAVDAGEAWLSARGGWSSQGR